MPHSVRTKAIVFTHLSPRGMQLDHPADFKRFYDAYGRLLKSCLGCPNIGLVYAYVSYGLEQFIVQAVLKQATRRTRREPVEVPFGVLQGDGRFHNALRIAVDKATDELKRRGRRHFDASRAPRVEFVGVRELANLLHTLWRHDPKLLTYLAGTGARFTYDSPKFIEAVIRIARGQAGLGWHPILRIDADVEVNESAVNAIISQANALRRHVDVNPFWWFSGCYTGNFRNDPVNTHAVRQHWLVDPATRQSPRAFRLLPKGEMFLRDLGELGATQVPSCAACSPPCCALAASRRGKSLSRAVPQVISGAGLVASLAAIQKLPPFMNAGRLIVWIDDHLKRRLHEAIRDIARDDVERIETATFRQNRFRDGISREDIRAARKEYFLRLLYGCLMHATIEQADRAPGPLALCVDRICQRRPRSLSRAAKDRLRHSLKSAAERRYDDVMRVWKKADYGDDLLKRWARGLKDRDGICSAAAEVGLLYAELLCLWPKYVEAIQSLTPLEAHWLFARLHT